MPANWAELTDTDTDEYVNPLMASVLHPFMVYATGQEVIAGFWVSVTDTVKLQLLASPFTSVAVAVTAVLPTGKSYGKVITVVPTL